jgi:hypothetical protein
MEDNTFKGICQILLKVLVQIHKTYMFFCSPVGEEVAFDQKYNSHAGLRQ